MDVDSRKTNHANSESNEVLHTQKGGDGGTVHDVARFRGGGSAASNCRPDCHSHGQNLLGMGPLRAGESPQHQPGLRTTAYTQNDADGAKLAVLASLRSGGGFGYGSMRRGKRGGNRDPTFITR